MARLNGIEWSCDVRRANVRSFVLSPFLVTVGFERAKASVCPRISDDVVIHVVVKGDIFGIIGRGRHRWELPGNYPVFTVVMAIYN